jgi:hypothetical protein
MPVLQDAFGALYNLASLQLAAHFGRLFLQSRVFFRQECLADRSAHLLAHECQKRNLVRRMLVRLSMVNIDNADYIAAADQGY